jgi:hydroxypyruvate reductase
VALHQETPKHVDNVETFIIGSVRVACEEAKRVAQNLGYTPLILTTTLACEAREAGRFLVSLAHEVLSSGQPITRPGAIILGGETVVQVKGDGLGGRNQELVLAAAIDLAGMEDVVIASVGTDGTDGPTDAAGGMVDGGTLARMAVGGVNAAQALANNDAYHALAASGELIKTGPTGTNVNDLALVLIR